MCGIWFCLGPCGRVLDNPNYHIRLLKGRGPEGSRRVDVSGVGVMGFTRLAINGLNSEGMQPMTNGRLWWMCNGEIYNWKALAEEYSIETKSGSDCEVLGGLYQKLVVDGELEPAAFFRLLDGVFACVIVDKQMKTAVIARDPYGVRPLFMGSRWTVQNGRDLSLLGYLFASEIKAMTHICHQIIPFPPGTCNVYNAETGALTYTKKYHSNTPMKNPFFNGHNGLEFASMSLRHALETAVRKRMMTERPVAALLSGGIDSSLIASLVARELRAAGAPKLKTFSVGMLGSQDLYYARKVAEWIDSDHHEIVLSADDFYNAIPHVIRAIESYDTTTVRASVGNWLVAREVKRQSDCKVVFNGDGSDEVFGSYLYFNRAPHDGAYEEEVSRLLEEIHMFDVLRSDRSISSHGLEPRTPFLDKEFVAVARSIPTKWLRPIAGRQPEKWLLRRAFDDGITLPHDVLWRRKEAFSDGVSSAQKSWYEIIQERVGEMVPEDWEERASTVYPYLTPKTAEQYYYRFSFEVEYGKACSPGVIPHFWMPRWSPETTDPSARTLSMY